MRPRLVRRGEPPPQDPESRREKLLQMLRDNPNVKYAMLSDLISEPAYAIVAVAIRGVATADIWIERDKYDGPAIIDMVERCGNTVH